jgi:hypothetical protein
MSTDQHPRKWATRGFLLAGCVNFFGSLLVSAGFTNDTLASLDPVVFSNFGIVAIMLWGMAYVAVSRSYHHVPYVVAVFACEKMVYAIIWILWMCQFRHKLPDVLSETPLTGGFYLTYGVVDFLFGVFFAWVAITTLRRRTSMKDA